MNPSSPIFPNLVKYVQRTQSGATASGKKTSDNPLFPKSNKVSDREAKLKDSSEESPKPSQDSDEFPSGQAENASNDSERGSTIIIDDSGSDVVSPSDKSFENPSGDSGDESSDIISSFHRRRNPVDKSRDLEEIASYEVANVSESTRTANPRTSLPSRKPTAKLRPKKRVRNKPNLLKEIQLHKNESFQARKTSLPDGFDVTEVHLTRHQAKMLGSIGLETESPSPSNFITNSPTKLASVDKTQSPTTLFSKYSLESPKITAPNSDQAEKSNMAPTPKSKMSNAKAWQMKKKRHGMIAWETWQNRKDKITALLQTPGYLPSAALDVQLPSPEPSKLSDQPMLSRSPKDSELLDSNLLQNPFDKNTPGEVDFEVTDDVYVFKPTVLKIMDFENFLSKVEEIAGRKMGVVKVIIPQDLLASCNDRSDEMNHPAENDNTSSKSSDLPNNPILRLNMTMLSPRITETNGLKIYDVRMMGGLNRSASKIVEQVHGFRKALADYLAKHGEVFAENEDIFKEVEYAAVQGREESMISKYAEIESRDIYYGVCEETKGLRNALQCNKIIHNIVQAQKAVESSGHEEEGRKSVFHVAGLFGSTLGLRTTDSAAYGINILHRGAPKCWTIVEPADHVRVEKEFHPDSENAGGRQCRIQREPGSSTGNLTPAERAEDKLINEVLKARPCDLPPRCDQFMAHQPFYIPEVALSSANLRYRKVAQHQGEMIIIFPFAYYQVYATGNSVAEATSYTNDRSNIFVKNNLYGACHHDCTALRDKDNWVDYMESLQEISVPSLSGPPYMPVNVPANSFPHARSLFDCDKTASTSDSQVTEE